jgi:glucosamine 6-phosphate synthetase-like amidotransferase/phosphosugar isomerase protein
MSAAAGFAASSFFEQAASVNVALQATSNNRFADAENMASPFVVCVIKSRRTWRLF